MKVLVVVDVQNDFITGKLGSEEAKKIIPNIIEKVKKATEDSQTLVVFTKDTHNIDSYNKTIERAYVPQHCIESTEGWSIVKEVRKTWKEITPKLSLLSTIRNTIYKDTYGSVKLMEKLKPHKDLITEIEFIGVCTGICVLSNAILARSYFPEIQVSVDASCCACLTPETHKNALEAMKVCNIVIEGENDNDNT